MSEQSTALLEQKIKELQNVHRLITNTVNLIGDVEIKGAYAGPVAEIQQWLEGFKQSVNTQMQALQAALPKIEEKKEESKPIEATVV